MRLPQFTEFLRACFLVFFLHQLSPAFTQENIQIVQINKGDEYLSNSVDGSKIYQWNGINQQLEFVYVGLKSKPIKIFYVEQSQKIIALDSSEVLIWSLSSTQPEEKFLIPLEIKKDLIAFSSFDGNFNSQREKIELHDEVLYIGLGSVLIHFPYRKSSYTIKHQFPTFINKISYSEKGEYLLIEENLMPKRIHFFDLKSQKIKQLIEANGLECATNPEGEYVIIDYYGQKGSVFSVEQKKIRDFDLTEWVGHSKPLFLNNSIILIPFADSSVFMVNVQQQFVSYMTFINGSGLSSYRKGYIISVDQEKQEVACLSFDQFLSRRRNFLERDIDFAASKQLLSPGSQNNLSIKINQQEISLTDQVTCLHTDQQKTSYLGLANGSFGQVKDGQFKLIDQISNSVTALITKDSLLYIGSIGRVVCYDLKNKKFLKTHRCHEGFVPFLSLTSDGRFLLSGGMDGKLFLWDETSHSLVEQYFINETFLSIQLEDDLSIKAQVKKDSLHEIANSNLLERILSTELSVQGRLGHSSPIRSMSLRKNGEHLVSVDDDGVVKIWQTDQMIPIHTVQFDDGVTRVQFIEDGSTFFAFTGTSIMIIDTYSGKLIRKKSLPSYLKNFSILDVAAANNGRFFFITSVNSNDVWCYNLTTNYFGWFSEGPEPFSIKDIESVPGNDSLFVTIGRDGIYVFDTQKGGLVNKIHHPNNSNQNAYVNYTLAFSPNGRLLLAYHNDSISVYDFKQGKFLRNVKGLFGFFHSDTSLFFSGYYADKKSRYSLINPLTGQTYYTRTLPYQDYLTKHFSVDHTRSIGYLTRNEEIQLINLKSGNYFNLNSGLNTARTKAWFHPTEPNKIIVVQNKEITAIDRISGNKQKDWKLKGEDHVFSQDGTKYAVIRSADAKVYATDNNQLLYTLKDVSELIFTDQKRLVAYDIFKGLKIFNDTDGSLIFSDSSLDKKEEIVLSFFYSPMDRELVYIQRKGNNRYNSMSSAEQLEFLLKNTFISGVDISTGKVNYKKEFASEFTESVISSNGQLALRSGHHTIKFFLNGKTIDLQHTTWFESMFFSEDGDHFFITGSEGQLECFESKSGKFLYLKQYHDKSIRRISCQDTLLLTSGDDGKIILSSRTSGELIGTYLLFPNDDFVMIDANNYYMGSHQGVGSICFKKGNDYYPMEQFDAIKNRPDLVLKSFGEKDPEVLMAYEQAVKKRWKKIGLTTTGNTADFGLPQLTILNKASIPLITDQSKLTFHLKGNNIGSPLKCLHVWINDVPIYGRSGLKSSIEGLNQAMSKLELELQSGENKIQFAFMNVHGIEGEKQTVYINYEPKKQPQKKLYLITLGVSKYSDSLYNLYYASKDAHDIGDLFLKKKTEAFDSIIHISLTDNQLTRKNVLNLKNRLMMANRNDAVVISYSGHGLLDDKYNYYLATTDIQFKDPKTNGLPYEELESLLDGIAPLKKVLFIDACHSGEVEKEDILAKIEGIQIKDSVRGGETEYVSDESGISATELSKELFNDLRRGTGATIISASGGLEVAREGSQWDNGLFTYCLLKGLGELKADLNEDGIVMLNELQAYLQTEVINLSEGTQKPTSRLENLEMDWRVW